MSQQQQLYLYILLDPHKPDFCKVGITQNLKNRLRAYRTANPDCTFYATYPISTKDHERKLLSILKEAFTVKSEYVHCNPHIVNNIVSSYFDDINEFGAPSRTQTHTIPGSTPS